ncbi:MULTISPECIES: hypothetical protein [Clavibacter]|uniref:Uncharacterized protein n=1 Tax=Clavibacter tessellarius TaxID=31965 RepID=A0A154V4P8_9MICO|nr:MULTISPECIES: hypothetical protein [Clavibacter]KZC96144.1 hypothetical protein AWH51_05020 [Clavibacter michiganensis subsp. tessellarius]MDA3805061.1 hypothetical protein [Clavibacter sp. CT19]
MSRRTGAPRIGLILLTLAGIALASAGLATAVTMSVSAPVQAQADLAALGASDAGAGAARAPEPRTTPSEAWTPLPAEAADGRSITDLTQHAATRVTVDVLGMRITPGEAGALLATILSVPLVITVIALVAGPRRRRRWSGALRRNRG